MQPLHERTSVHLFAVWCAIGYILMLLLGWGLVAGFVPPLYPDAGADEVAALYKTDATRIRIGMVVVLFGALVFIPFAGTLSRFIMKIEGGWGVLSFTALLGSAGNMILTFHPAMTWLTPSIGPTATRRSSTVFPRWAGYLNLWLVLLIVPDHFLRKAVLTERASPGTTEGALV